MAQTDNQKGVSLLLISALSFAIGDSIFQSISGEIEIPQFLFLRGVLAVIFMGFFAIRSGKPFPRERRVQAMMVFRGFIELSVASAFLGALIFLPLSEVTAINQTVPLVMTVIAYFFLGERFGWRRLTAILVGFFGVLLIIKPGFSSFNWGYILAIYSVCGVTARDLISRSLPKDTPSIWAAFVTVTVVCIASGFISARAEWTPLHIGILFPIVICSIVSTIGHLTIVSAMRIGELSFVAPFRYSAIFITALIDVFAFHRPLDALSVVGCVLIAGAGIFTLRREAARHPETKSGVKS